MDTAVSTGCMFQIQKNPFKVVNITGSIVQIYNAFKVVNNNRRK